MSTNPRLVAMYSCLLLAICALPFGPSFASGRCTEDQVYKMKTGGFSDEEIATLCDPSVEQTDPAQKEKAEGNGSGNTGFTAKQDRWGPIVKGLQLGMPYNEAEASLKRQSSGNIRINTRLAPNSSLLIFLRDKTGRDYLSYLTGEDGRHDDGWLHIDDSGNVTCIFLTTRLVNALFNAYDVTTPDFVKAFADNYGINEWQQKIKKTDIDFVPGIHDTLTQEVWTFQGHGFTVEVSRTISSRPSIPIPGFYDCELEDQTDRHFAKEKSLTIELTKAKKPSPGRMTFD